MMVIPHGDMRETDEARENVYDVPDAIDPLCEHVVNLIPGHVITIRQSPLNLMRLRIAERTHLLVRWSLASPVMQGLTVGLAIAIKTLIPARGSNRVAATVNPCRVVFFILTPNPSQAHLEDCSTCSTQKFRESLC